MKTPTAEELARISECLAYEPETGLLRWRINRYDRQGRLLSKANIGDIAGCKNRGYIVIGLDYIMYRAHRVAWFLHYGVWPTVEIDHWDTCRSNNRIANLRRATRVQNRVNTRYRNKSGFKGVHKIGTRWQAAIGVKRGKIYLGMFDSPDEAHEVYCLAAVLLHGEFANPGSKKS